MMPWTALRRLNWRGFTVCAVALRLNVNGTLSREVFLHAQERAAQDESREESLSLERGILRRELRAVGRAGADRRYDQAVLATPSEQEVGCPSSSRWGARRGSSCQRLGLPSITTNERRNHGADDVARWPGA
jgi:hypothetical protein